MPFFQVKREFTDDEKGIRYYPYQLWEGTSEATILSHQLGGVIGEEVVPPEPPPPDTLSANP